MEYAIPRDTRMAHEALHSTSGLKVAAHFVYVLCHHAQLKSAQAAIAAAFGAASGRSSSTCE